MSQDTCTNFYLGTHLYHMPPSISLPAWLREMRGGNEVYKASMVDAWIIQSWSVYLHIYISVYT